MFLDLSSDIKSIFFILKRTSYIKRIFLNSHSFENFADNEHEAVEEEKEIRDHLLIKRFFEFSLLNCRVHH